MKLSFAKQVEMVYQAFDSQARDLLGQPGDDCRLELLCDQSLREFLENPRNKQFLRKNKATRDKVVQAIAGKLSIGESAVFHVIGPYLFGEAKSAARTRAQALQEQVSEQAERIAELEEQIAEKDVEIADLEEFQKLIRDQMIEAAVLLMRFAGCKQLTLMELSLAAKIDKQGTDNPDEIQEPSSEESAAEVDGDSKPSDDLSASSDEQAPG